MAVKECPACKGSTNCPNCGGTGKKGVFGTTCPKCNGDGNCTRCKGKGVVPEK